MHDYLFAIAIHVWLMPMWVFEFSFVLVFVGYRRHYFCLARLLYKDFIYLEYVFFCWSSTQHLNLADTSLNKVSEHIFKRLWIIHKSIGISCCFSGTKKKLSKKMTKNGNFSAMNLCLVQNIFFLYYYTGSKACRCLHFSIYHLIH